MDQTATALTDLFQRIPRRHSADNVKEINALVKEFEDLLIFIEGINPFYEKAVPAFFDELETIKAGIKKSTDNKASKKNKDNYFDEASGAFKVSLQALLELYGDGKRC